MITFKGATAYEFSIGKLWVRVPYWEYIKLGCYPTAGIEKE